jgi:hypothetical protein
VTDYLTLFPAALAAGSVVAFFAHLITVGRR